MKFVKMSLAAAMLMGASAFAIDNVKVDGAANLFYSTTDDGSAGSDLFDKASTNAAGDYVTAGQASLKLGATADLTTGVSAGVTLYAISTLGLEGVLVDNVWESGTEDQYWFGEAWLAATVGKTTAKAGRMELDTPLLFTEGWSVAPNTFESAVLLNQDIPNTTLVAAFVGKHNSSGAGAGAGIGANINSFQRHIFVNNDGSVDADGNPTYTAGDDTLSLEQNNNFEKFYNGAYAIGAVTTAIPMTTAQAWYYDIQSTAKAYWLQADVDVEGIMFGAQYANMDPDAAGVKSSKAYALMAGYAMPDVVTIKAAYSSADEDGVMRIANTATGFESKLYTEKWWNFGVVGDAGSDSYSLTAEAAVAGVDLFAGYYVSEVDVVGTANDYDLTEFTVTAGKSFGPLDATLAYIYADTDAFGIANDVDSDTIQVYLTYNF